MSASAFVAGAFVGLVLVAGIAVDGAAQASAHRNAEVTAAQAARAGSDAAASRRLVGESGTSAAVAAAEAVLANHPGVSGSVTLDHGMLSVTTHTSTRTVFLSIVGIDRVTGDGSSSAELRPA